MIRALKGPRSLDLERSPRSAIEPCDCVPYFQKSINEKRKYKKIGSSFSCHPAGEDAFLLNSFARVLKLNIINKRWVCCLLPKENDNPMRHHDSIQSKSSYIKGSDDLICENLLTNCDIAFAWDKGLSFDYFLFLG